MQTHDHTLDCSSITVRASLLLCVNCADCAQERRCERQHEGRHAVDLSWPTQTQVSTHIQSLYVTALGSYSCDAQLVVMHEQAFELFVKCRRRVLLLHQQALHQALALRSKLCASYLGVLMERMHHSILQPRLIRPPYLLLQQYQIEC
jgi:hypothetical protein